MRRRVSMGALAAAVIAVLPQVQQQGQRCALELHSETPGAEAQIVTSERGDRLEWRGGVQATCGPKWARADSLNYYEAMGLLYLYGNVKYRDGERTLEAERATYSEAEDRVRSEGNVVLTASDGRSTLSGPIVDYFPSNDDRPVERIYATRRPHLTFYADTSGGPDSEPFDVDANRMNIFGDSRIAAAGQVAAERGDLVAHGDSMDLDMDRGELWLLGSPNVEAGKMLLSGDSILALMEGNQVREIDAWPSGEASGNELTLQAPLLRLFVEEGDITRVIAARGDSSRTGASDVEGRDPWARSVSAKYELVADSIDIRRPAGRLDQVIAVDRALATTRDPLVPGGGLLESDWLEGDTIRGYFAAPDSATLPDSASGEQAQLERLEALGQARALYHLAATDEQGGAAGQPGVNYVIGRIVILKLVAGEVREARVIGPSTGIYLEPKPPVADSTAAPEDTTGGGA